MLTSFELFAGAGGLALGAALAGFRSLGVVERDKAACATIRENIRRGNPLAADWRAHEQDARGFDFSQAGAVDLLCAGPPCQPFSLGGRHRAARDDRDMFPATVAAIRALKPKAFLIENVKGLLRPAFANYFQYILLQLSHPEITARDGEGWEAHLARLKRERTSGAQSGLRYDAVHRLALAADYGVPQLRERVFIAGFRHDLGIRWAFPKPTHSLDALLREQWRTGAYWERHGILPPRREALKNSIQRRIAKLKPELFNAAKPWRTTRDALQGLPDPRSGGDDSWPPNHNYQSGAKAYPGHTGSFLDLPAKTIKAGAHGVPGGENMVTLDDGSLRYFTCREAARLQCFPDSYVFASSWTESMRQIGNAVPVELGRVMAASIARQLLEAEEKRIRQRMGGM